MIAPPSNPSVRSKRLPVTKTPKVYVGGAFIRSESGRTYPIHEQGDQSRFFANIPLCTRKDIRNAVEAAAKAGPDWARRTPYNRGQILYRLGEMLESRSDEMARAITVASDASADDAEREVAATVDRLIYYAGWTDKFAQVLGNTNPVAGPFFNFTVAEPMGIIGVIAPERAPLLGLVSLVAPVIASGNVVVALASESQPYPAIVLGEMLATSDLPGGVVNLLTGSKKELIATFATHTHIRGLSAHVSADARKQIALGAAESIKRVNAVHVDDDTDWYSDDAESVYRIREFVEFKTTWHPVGV